MKRNSSRIVHLVVCAVWLAIRTRAHWLLLMGADAGADAYLLYSLTVARFS